VTTEGSLSFPSRKSPQNKVATFDWHENYNEIKSREKRDLGDSSSNIGTNDANSSKIISNPVSFFFVEILNSHRLSMIGWLVR